jgi:hypothetical protein
MLRSEELIEVWLSGVPYMLKRWQAERLGISPVTISRCFRALTDNSMCCCQFLLDVDDLPRLFRREHYFQPVNTYWQGAAIVKDESDRGVIGVFPFTFNKQQKETGR